MKGKGMATIKSLNYRKILNSHVEFTTEFIIELDNGSVGVGSSPKGETISVYEDRKVTITPGHIIETLRKDGLLKKELNQEMFDNYLQENISAIGRNNAYSLSLAFFNAVNAGRSIKNVFNVRGRKLLAPKLCLNILNGGRYAYTNPVHSDFSEFMVVAKTDNIGEVIGEHAEIQKAIKAELIKLERVNIAGNMVHRFDTTDNRKCIELLIKVLEKLGLREKYDLMIDASAGDLWDHDHYDFSITGSGPFSSEAFVDYWINFIREYGIRFLEDPFHEKDYSAWQKLTQRADGCLVIGDNLYSSQAARIKHGHEERLTHGVVIKPNQSGTITGVREAIEMAQNLGQIIITSHRSISTEETFVSVLSCVYNADYIKIGPLMTDYSSVLRLNEIIRLTEE